MSSPSAGRGIMASGVVLGALTGLLLWLLCYVGPIWFIPFIIIGAILGALIFGIPGILFDRKVRREREQASAESEAARAAAHATSAAQPAVSQYVVVNIAPQTAPAYAAPPNASSAVVNVPVYTSPSVPPPPPPMVMYAPKAPPQWPTNEPLCVMEASQEKDVWETVHSSALTPDRLLCFTTGIPEDIAREYGLMGAKFYKVTRVEGEGAVNPGDLDRLGNLIEMHFGTGPGKAVALPALENLVAAGTVQNVRRLLEVMRDIAQQSHGTMLVSVDPVSLSSMSVALLERGMCRLTAS